MTAFLFLTGGTLYMLCELVYRGRTHISMGIAAGLACVILYGLYSAVEMPLWRAYLWSAAVITAIEFITGYVVNIRMKLGVWDYSGKMDVYGQICLPYSLLWGAMGAALWAL